MTISYIIVLFIAIELYMITCDTSQVIANQNITHPRKVKNKIKPDHSFTTGIPVTNKYLNLTSNGKKVMNIRDKSSKKSYYHKSSYSLTNLTYTHIQTR